MTQKTPEFSLKQQRGAVLVAEDELTDEDIAQELAISRPTLARWKRDPTFQSHVAQHVSRLSAELSKYQIARKDKRVAEYNERWRLLKQVRQERAVDPDLAHIAGGDTGLIVKRLKMIGAGESAHMVEEYEVDTGTLSAMLHLEKQAAQEVGQWTEKSEHRELADVRFTISFDRISND